MFSQLDQSHLHSLILLTRDHLLNGYTKICDISELKQKVWSVSLPRVEVRWFPTKPRFFQVKVYGYILEIAEKVKLKVINIKEIYSLDMTNDIWTAVENSGYNLRVVIWLRLITTEILKNCLMFYPSGLEALDFNWALVSQCSRMLILWWRNRVGRGVK